jgi:hypothetical protein
LTSPRSSFQNDPQLTLVRNSLSKKVFTIEKPNADNKNVGDQKEPNLTQKSSILNTQDGFISSSAHEITEEQTNQYQTSLQLNPMSQATNTNNNHVFLSNDFVDYDSSSHNNLFQ